MYLFLFFFFCWAILYTVSVYLAGFCNTGRRSPTTAGCGHDWIPLLLFKDLLGWSSGQNATLWRLNKKF